MRPGLCHHPGVGDALGGATLALLLGLGACTYEQGFTVQPGTIDSDGSAFHPLRTRGLPASFYLQVRGGELVLAGDLEVTIGGVPGEVLAADGEGLTVRAGHHLDPGAYAMVVRVGGTERRALHDLQVVGTGGDAQVPPDDAHAPGDGSTTMDAGLPDDAETPEDAGLPDDADSPEDAATPADGGLQDASPPPLWQGCDPECDECVRTCLPGEACECREGCCDLTCGAHQNCSAVCQGSGTVCGFHVGAGKSVGFNCHQDAQCFVDARHTSSARIRCQESTCTVRCEDAEDCRVRCEAGSVCTLHCAGADDCGFDRCTGSAVTHCGDGVYTCGGGC